VPKKSIETDKPDTGNTNGQPTTATKAKDAEQQIRRLIEKGRKKGFLTYEEMNEDMPEEAVSPARLDSLLATLDEMKINLLDEDEVKKEAVEEFETPEDTLGEEEAVKKGKLKDDELLERQLIGTEVARRVDDPIRMYLTQMGEIPLLTRKSEISLARKIELARMAFRRKMLESDYCARNAVDILRQVYAGTLSFDRTIKMSNAENLVRAVIKKRLTPNIETVDKLLKIDQKLFKKFLQNQDSDEGRSILKRIHRNKRKIATLLEELSLRTSRIQPMKNKLHGICQKMRRLEQIIADGANRDVTSEDIDAVKQELAGLQELVMETPAQLDKRLHAVDRVFGKYEETKRTLSSANLKPQIGGFNRQEIS